MNFDSTIHVQRLLSRSPNSHKGSFGHGLLVGGMSGMSGAMVIAGKACLRSGAGLVTIASSDHSIPIIAGASPCYMTLALPTREDRLTIDALNLLRSPQLVKCVLGIGPGLGRSKDSDAIVSQLLIDWPASAVVDADALNAIADSEAWKSSIKTSAPLNTTHSRILTPHPGEWQRLCGVDRNDRTGQCERAVRVAALHSFVIVLKGNRTFVTDGTRHYENTTGNPSMANGGMGDCLTGIIVAFLCQQMRPFDAAVLAVNLHGLAGDLANRCLRSPNSCNRRYRKITGSFSSFRGHKTR
jgi:ADP-dependent NAD(P)H-hydrate dehydratase